ncbi:unnamed protein product [Heligmosomoides polygyrus]|uniref:Secreted protein n=1 Tax=Heligmosomoides polygyrus TaxID=6339 RepID=A0A183FC87_HELPZ|nr:unnamed protein product [Heligmosomoides polygyrus]
MATSRWWRDAAKRRCCTVCALRVPYARLLSGALMMMRSAMMMIATRLAKGMLAACAASIVSAKGSRKTLMLVDRGRALAATARMMI